MPSDVGIPILVLAEFLFGTEKSVREEQNGARIMAVWSRLRVVGALAFAWPALDPRIAQSSHRRV